MKTAIVIDFDHQKIRAVELAQGKNGIEIIRFAIRELPAVGLSAAWLKTFWNEEKFSRNRVIVTIPNRLIQYKSVLVPKLTEDQLFAAAQMELEGTGGREDDLKIMLYHHKDKDMIAVKLSIVDNKELEAMGRMFNEVGLDVAWFGFRSHGLLNFIQFNSQFLGETQPELFIDITPQTTEMGLCSGDSLVFCREFEPGSLGFIGNETISEMNDFCQELRLSLAASRSLEKGSDSSRNLWGFGPIEILNKISQSISDQTGVTLKIPLKTSLAGVVTENHTTELAPLLGLGLEGIGWSDMERLHVFSRAQQNEQVQKGRWRTVAVYLIVGILVAGGLILGFQAQAEKAGKVSAWLAAHAGIINTLRKAEAETRGDMNQVKVLQSYSVDGNRELDFFKALEENLPEGAAISDVTIEDGMVKDLSGTAPVASIVLNRLKKSSVLNRLQLKGTIQVTEKGEAFHLQGPIGTGPAAKETER